MFSKILLLNFYLGILKNHFWCEIGKITLYSLWEFWVQERHMSLIQKSEFVVTTECALLLHNQLLWRSWQRVGLIIPRSPVRSRSKAYVLPDSLGGQDTRLSPERPGLNSQSGNFFPPLNSTHSLNAVTSILKNWSSSLKTIPYTNNSNHG